MLWNVVEFSFIVLRHKMLKDNFGHAMYRLIAEFQTLLKCEKQNCIIKLNS